MKNYSQNHPHIFSLIIVFIAVLFALLGQLPTIPFPNQKGISSIIEGFCLVLASLPFIYLLSRFGWLKAAGFQRPKENSVWILVALAIIYTSVSFILSLYKSLNIYFPDLMIVLGIIISMLGTGLYEETIYRGVIQTIFYQKWAYEPKGIFKAVIVSALYYAISHFIGLASGANPIYIIGQVIHSIGLGIIFSTLLIYSKSIWPAIVAHWLINNACTILLQGLTIVTNKIILIASTVYVGTILPLSIGALWLAWWITKTQERNV